jgi:hypothetical protein
MSLYVQSLGKWTQATSSRALVRPALASAFRSRNKGASP